MLPLYFNLLSLCFMMCLPFLYTLPLIDQKLTFKNHITQKCKSASTVLNMSRRNLYFAPVSVKMKAYKACIMPLIEYGSNCWAPTSTKLANSIEIVQHHAARFIANAYYNKKQHKNMSITKILENLNLESFNERRIRSRLIMAYKILNNKVILGPDLLTKTCEVLQHVNCRTRQSLS